MMLYEPDARRLKHQLRPGSGHNEANRGRASVSSSTEESVWRHRSVTPGKNTAAIKILVVRC